MKKILFVFFLALAGCKINYFPQYYDEEISQSDYIPLQSKYSKVVFGNSEKELDTYIKNGYIILGKSVYIGENTCPHFLLEEFARERKATIAFALVVKTGEHQKTISTPGYAYSNNGFTTYTAPSSFTYTVPIYNNTTYYLALKKR